MQIDKNHGDEVEDSPICGIRAEMFAHLAEAGLCMGQKVLNKKVWVL